MNPSGIASTDFYANGKQSTEEKEHFMALWKEIVGYDGLYLISGERNIIALPKAVSIGFTAIERRC